MAIKNSKGERVSPKQLAKELVASAVEAVTGEPSHEGMTDKEKELLAEQLGKVKGRVLKLLQPNPTEE